jgi:hypothetical protein
LRDTQVPCEGLILVIQSQRTAAARGLCDSLVSRAFR